MRAYLWRTVTVVAVLAWLALMCAGCTSLQRARVDYTGAVAQMDATYTGLWVDVFKDRLDTATGVQARSLYQTVYYPAKVRAYQALYVTRIVTETVWVDLMAMRQTCVEIERLRLRRIP